MKRLLRKIRRAVLDEDPSFLDMAMDAKSVERGVEYLARIRQHLTEAFGQRRLTILDAGCQGGRLLVPLAQDGHAMTGVDTSGFALRRARHNLRSHGATARLIRGDIAQLPQWLPERSVDAALCLEVLYLCRNYRELLRTLAAMVRPGGLLFVSHRAQAYYLATALINRRPDLALETVRRAEGPSVDGDYHNWQTPEQLERLYAEAGLRALAIHPMHVWTTDAVMPPVKELELEAALRPLRNGSASVPIPIYYLVAAHVS